MGRDDSLADLDAARQEWETAFAHVPDEALGYLKPGDDYALGGLQVHVNWVLLHYSRVLDGIIANRFGQLPPQDRPGEADEAVRRARAGMTAGERKKCLADMERLHADVQRSAAKVPATDWERKAPVVYGAGQDPFPTSPDEIVGWLRDHYREHVQQSADLVEEWRSSPTEAG